MDGIGAMFCVTIFDKEIVNSFRNFCCAVKPPHYNNKCVSLALLKLCDVTDVERLVRSLTLNKYMVTNLVLDVVVITAISQIFSFTILPSFSK